MKTDKRKALMVEPQQHNKPVDSWTDEQRRLGGAWSKHEIEVRYDSLTSPYEWVPGWTSLTPDEIQDQLRQFYNLIR